MHVLYKQERGELMSLMGAGDALNCSDHLCKPLNGEDTLFERIFSLSLKFTIVPAVPVMDDFQV